MLTATIFAVFYIPFFFIMVRRGVRDGIARLRGRPTGHQGKDDQPPAPPMPPGPEPSPTPGSPSTTAEPA